MKIQMKVVIQVNAVITELFICVYVCILTRLVKETLMQIYSDEHFADILDYSN